MTHTTITKKLTKDIHQFLKDWKQSEEWEFFGVDDWKNFMEGAVSLLKDVVGEKDDEEDI